MREKGRGGREGSQKTLKSMEAVRIEPPTCRLPVQCINHYTTALLVHVMAALAATQLI